MDFLKSIDPRIWAAIIVGVLGIVAAFIARGKKSKDPPQPSQSTEVQINPGRDANLNAPVVGGNQTNVGNTTTYITNPPAEPKTPTIKPLHQIPPPDGDFIGREEELKELLDKVKLSGVHISGIRGMGGIGKTQLAYRLVEELKPQYPDAQIYLDLKGVTEDDQISVKPEEALAHIIRAFEPEIQLPEKVEELRPIFLSVLDNKKAILLMDNALDEKQTEPLIPPAGSLLLVTSRKNFSLPGIHLVPLDTLPEEESIQLLLNIADRIGDHAKPIAELCGYLPKALNVAGKAMAEHPDYSPEEYIEELKKNEALEPVDRSLAASCKWLEEVERNYFYKLCVFPGTFDSRAAGAVWETDEAEAKKTLSNLVNISLVEWGEETHRYHLHDLTRVYANKQLKDQEHYITQKRHAEHYLKILAEADELFKEKGGNMLAGLHLFDLEWENIETSQAWSAENSKTDEKARKFCLQFMDSTKILDLRKHPNKRIEWAENGFEAAEHFPDHESKLRNQLKVADNKCRAYRHKFETKLAIDWCNKWLENAKKLGDRRSEILALVNLGINYDNWGQAEEALDYLENASDLFEKHKNEFEKPWEVEFQIIANFGIVYRHQGKLERSIIKCLEWKKIVEENDDKQKGVALSNLGRAYSLQGKIEQGRDLQKEALKLANKNSRDESMALNKLGWDYRCLRDTKTAIKMHEKALEVAQMVGHRREEGKALWYQSLAENENSNKSYAVQLAKDALIIFQAIKDPRINIVEEQLEKWKKET